MKIKKVKQLAKRQAEISCSWVNVPQIGDYINPDIDYFGLGKIVTEENKWEYFQLICEARVAESFYSGILTEKQKDKIDNSEELYGVWQESVSDYICEYIGQMKELDEDL